MVCSSANRAAVCLSSTKLPDAIAAFSSSGARMTQSMNLYNTLTCAVDVSVLRFLTNVCTIPSAISHFDVCSNNSITFGNEFSVNTLDTSHVSNGSVSNTVSCLTASASTMGTLLSNDSASAS